MREEILTEKQQDLLPLIKSFNKNFGLVGGTAIALHIGHRRSIDFDLFTNTEFENEAIRRKLGKFNFPKYNIRDETGQYTWSINEVKCTFFYYPFKIDFSENLDEVIKLPDLLTLAAMKAYALGRRAKWKDYVDLYFVIKKYHGVEAIIKKAKEIFTTEFNEKMIRTQIAYFNDINYSEQIEYMPGFETNEKTIQKELVDFALSTDSK